MRLPSRHLFQLLIVFALLLFPLEAIRAQGIDVSKYQGKINFRKIAKARTAKFVYIRATEGSSIKDGSYQEHLDSARAAGLYVGSYHVYSSKSPIESQFRNFKSMVVKKYQDLIPVLDIEGYYSGRLEMDKVDKLLALMEKEYGAKPMIYTSEMVYKTHFATKKYADYHFFIARYKGTPTVRYTLWQYSKTGRMTGIKGDVDLDRFNPSYSISDILLTTKRKKPTLNLDTANKLDTASKTDTTARVDKTTKVKSAQNDTTRVKRKTETSSKNPYAKKKKRRRGPLL